MDLNMELVTSCFKMGGGTADASGTGEKRTVINTTTPAVNDQWSITIVDGVTEEALLIGAGNMTGVTPTACYTYGNKVYVLAGNSVYFSAVGAPTVFNSPQGVGNGFVSMANQTQTSENLAAMAPFQGRLAFLSRQTTQIWAVDADPDNWSLQQVLQNVGTIAKASVQPKGDLDVLFLADTGIRSLRAREATLNAFVDDLGSPIDSLVRGVIEANAILPGTPAGTPSASGGALATGTYYYTVSAVVGGVETGGVESAAIDVTGPSGRVTLSWTAVSGATGYKVYRTTTKGNYYDALISSPSTNSLIDGGLPAAAGAPRTKIEDACSVIEPTSGRYLLYLSGTIYVLSYFPSAKTVAWSIYEPLDSTGKVFAPTKFVIYKGQVYARAGNRLFRYGGASGVVYDSTVATVETPWLDLKSPGKMKSAKSINAAYSGSWAISIGMDPVSGILESDVWSGADYTFDKGVVPVAGRGSHFRAKMVSSGSTAAVFSALAFHYQEEEET